MSTYCTRCTDELAEQASLDAAIDSLPPLPPPPAAPTFDQLRVHSQSALAYARAELRLREAAVRNAQAVVHHFERERDMAASVVRHHETHAGELANAMAREDELIAAAARRAR
jgi:hypothetical protein